MKSSFLIFTLLITFGLSFQAHSQCTNCTFSAPSGGTNFNLNGNQTLCITANASNLGWNMNGTGNKICVAAGVIWDQPFGGSLQAGTVIDVYGTLTLGSGFNVNGTPPNAVINVHAGGTLNNAGGFGNGTTVNNDGVVNFTSTSGIDVTGSFILNNSVTGTVNALTTTNFKLGNSATINNNGKLHFANFENEEGYLNNNTGATLIVDRSMNNHGAFINNGDFQIPCTTLSGAAGATTCSFRVGDKGVGKEFISNACIKVLNGNVTFDGPGTLNNGFEIGSGFNLTINKTVTGNGGSFLVKGGTSTINLSGNYIGTNMKFFDMNTAGNSFDNNFNINTPSNFTVNSSAGCSAVVCTKPTIITTVTQATCTGSTANSDASIVITTTNGDKYKITNGGTSTETYASATALTTNSGNLISIANPTLATQYTIRVFNGSDACFKDTTVTLNPKDCVMPVCSVSLTTVPTICNPTTNTYSILGSLTFNNPPTSGTLTVSDGTTTHVFNAPFTSPTAYTITGLISDGLSHKVTAVFSASPDCGSMINYTAPISCNYGSIGDYVWTDQNNNGQQDGTETPIQGVKVYLLNGTTGAKLDSALTDATGKYLFDSLLTGSYKVQFVAPAGTIAAKQNTGADVTDSDANKAGLSQLVNIDTTKLPTDTLRNNPQIDAGFVPFGSIGDYVFNDKDNSNTQTAGDLPISGVKVYLLNATTGAKLDSTVTDAAGLYKFDSLIAGNYKVQVVVPTGMTAVTKDAGTDDTKDSDIDSTGTTGTVTVDTNKPIGNPLRDITSVDAGIKAIPQYGSIGDYVWFDNNNNGLQDGTENPIQGVKVYLYNATGTTKLDSALTDATGKYLFDSLLTGSYKVQFVAPAGTIAAKQNTGADATDSDANKLGFSQVVNIGITKLATDTLRNNPQIDAGFVPFGSIGDYVFNDKDNSNTQTAGDTPVAGVKVYLLNATTGAKLDSTVTDAAGLYKFDSLIAGNYKVQFVVPTGMTAVTKDSGTDDTKDSDIDPTGTTGTVTVDTTKPIGDPLRDITSVDAGLKGIPQYGSIGDYVWFDNNNNGQQDGTENPIQGVKVYLLNGTTGAKLDSALTDATGKYLFDSLLTGSYKVQFVAPAGTIAAKQNTGADVTDSDANKLGFSQVVNIDITKLATDTLRNNPQIDAGFVPVGSLGDYVFNDKDNSNTQTAGDTPVAGVKVYLLNATTGAKLDSTVTDAAGLYKFDSLIAGNYKVQVVVPTGMTAVTKDSGTDDTKDSDIDPTGTTGTVTVDTNKPIGDPLRDITSVDAGIKAIPQYGSIGDYVWFDNNNNGQQDGTENPIQGVKVYLYNAAGTTKLDSALTDATGKYLFDSLLTGAYKVKFVAPAGTIATKQNIGVDVTDSDANKLGFSQVVNIDITKLATDTLRNNPQIDAGFVPFGSIGDYVFNDKDNSNTQTAGDLPISGVKVYLLDATTGAKLDSTVTDAAGLYKFDSLIAGNYKVQVVVPTGMTAVTKDAGTDDTKDSDIDSTGTTGTVTVDTNKPIGNPLRDITSVDAGIKAIPQYGSIGDYVWFDNNNNGLQDGTENPIQGVKVYLYNAAGTTKLDSALTDATGKYLFDSLLTGAYKVKFVAPAGTIAAKQNIGVDVTDSDANKLGFSQVVNIDITKLATDTLRNNPQIDAGFVPVGSIGDYVFNDKDNSNTQTAGDTPVAGVKVYLLDVVTGAKFDSTVTNINGLYQFDSLVAGNYKIQFVAPTGASLIAKNSGADNTKDSDADSTGTTGIITVDTTKPVGDATRKITSVDAGLSFKVDLRLTKVAVGDCKRKVGDVVSFKVMVKRQDLIVTDVTTTIKDSLSANFEFVSASTTEGTYSNITGIWSGITLTQGDSAVLTINARIKQGVTGLACNDAWILTMDKGDFDSIAGNKIETEDDYARACVSVPLSICTERGEKIEISALPGYSSYQWYRNGVLISGGTNNAYIATTFGEYTVSINSSGCITNNCCPIYIEEFCDCPKVICLPYSVQKTKSRK